MQLQDIKRDGMKRPDKKDQLSKEKAVQFESEQFEEYYVWLQEHMPDGFFEEIEPDQYMLIAHYLMGFPLLHYYCHLIIFQNTSKLHILNTS